MKHLLTHRTVVATLRVQVNDHLAVEISESVADYSYVHLRLIPQGSLPLSFSILREDIRELARMLGKFADSVMSELEPEMERDLVPA
jgi:hypothetical protein